MNIRKAKIVDLNNIMKMYKSCITGMLKNGIDQWDNTYPNSSVILEDLKANTYFIAEVEEEIVGGINIDSQQDPTYLNIDWEDKNNQFLVVHRLAVKEEFWNQSIGKELMLFAEELVVKKNLSSNFS